MDTADKMEQCTSTLKLRVPGGDNLGENTGPTRSPLTYPKETDEVIGNHTSKDNCCNENLTNINTDTFETGHSITMNENHSPREIVNNFDMCDTSVSNGAESCKSLSNSECFKRKSASSSESSEQILSEEKEKMSVVDQQLDTEIKEDSSIEDTPQLLENVEPLPENEHSRENNISSEREHLKPPAENEQHNLTGPVRRRQETRQQRRDAVNPAATDMRIAIPPALAVQWREIGFQWGLENDNDIARVLLQHYEDMRAGRPPRPPPQPRCRGCGERMRPAPCTQCGPNQHHVRFDKDEHKGGGSGSSSGGFEGGGFSGGKSGFCGRCRD